jgi:hypothetical protein
MTIENVKSNETMLYTYRSHLLKLVNIRDRHELVECNHARRVDRIAPDGRPMNCAFLKKRKGYRIRRHPPRYRYAGGAGGYPPEKSRN